MIRHPQVAGQFYPETPSLLRRQIQCFTRIENTKEQAKGLVVPHAGYTYSGKVAAECFSRVNITETVVIIGPNHTGQGKLFSLMAEGIWQTPLGEVSIDQELSEKILSVSKNLQSDFQAHIHEHSIEVEVPFLQYFLPEVKIVPIIVATADYNAYEEIGKAIATAIKTSKNTLVVASSDMTHYAPEKKAKENDARAIEKILTLDGKGLLETVNELKITMCGYGPVACMLSATKELGAHTAKLIKYQTSGDTSGDYSSVVGYAGIMVK